jgi:hypothetical protein
MKKQHQIIPENIKLLKIDVLESSIRDIQKTEEVKFFLEISHNIQHNLNDERVKIGLSISVNAEDVKEKENQSAGAIFKFDFHYKIKDLNFYYDLDEGGNPIFSSLLIATLAGISYSTSRGMVFERLANTTIGPLHLPVINPSKIIDPKNRIIN